MRGSGARMGSPDVSGGWGVAGTVHKGQLIKLRENKVSGPVVDNAHYRWNSSTSPPEARAPPHAPPTLPRPRMPGMPSGTALLGSHVPERWRDGGPSDSGVCPGHAAPKGRAGAQPPGFSQDTTPFPGQGTPA